MKQFPSRRWRGRAAYLFAILWCSTTLLFAHSDPRGDIYPNVKVERGNFVIDFENNEDQFTRNPRAPFESSLLLRMIYSADGVLLAPRHVHRGTRGLNDTLGYPAKTEAIVGPEKISLE